MSPRIAILGGLRTPFAKSATDLRSVEADDLGAVVVRELLARADVDPGAVDEVVFGNVAQPIHAANVARVIALKAGLPEDTTALTVHRNCASGIESITTGAQLIAGGRARLVVAGGTESMSRIPLLVGARMTELFMRLATARSLLQRTRALASFRPAHLRPVIALKLGLTDPICELNMGQTAEVLAREFGITRGEQDAFALESHRRVCAARERLAEEIVPVVPPPGYDRVIATDNGPRDEQSMEALAKLKPYFDRESGTVTVGNACPVTDGAGAVLLGDERMADELGIEPLGYLGDWAYAALAGDHMGLGPVFATSRLLARGTHRIDDFDLIELNEAFAAQVLANLRAFASAPFARGHLDRDEALGAIDPERLNVNGGAIAVGHPVGATGTRLVITLLRELRRRGLERGLATLCVGGGQGAALVLEAA
ncbi:MAG: thiolase family protein [Planctomycetota bacterium]|jgi:acetyl-CoA C-acetyltransferase/acetyl-CoA acyltransferase